MKIKRFKNLWAMGLLLFGALLIAFYLIKIFFPKFIVGVAEIPSIVKFGDYVDKHWWAIALFNGITSFISLYLYGCACCKVVLLNYKENIIVVFLIIGSQLIEKFMHSQMLAFNFSLYLIIPLFISWNRKLKDNLIFSTSICFLITTFAQSLSLEIRGIVTLISYPNTATYFVLLIDLYIWTTLLYLYFNYKGDNKNG